MSEDFKFIRVRQNNSDLTAPNPEQCHKSSTLFYKETSFLKYYYFRPLNLAIFFLQTGKVLPYSNISERSTFWTCFENPEANFHHIKFRLREEEKNVWLDFLPIFLLDILPFWEESFVLLRINTSRNPSWILWDCPFQSLRYYRESLTVCRTP